MAPLSNRIRGIVVGMALLVATVLVAACGGPDATTVPAPTGAEWVPAPYFGWGSGYETFCNHGNRVYSSTGGGLAVAPNDPSCKTG